MSDMIYTDRQEIGYRLKQKLFEANEQALQSVCTVHIQNIFAQLHAKAVQIAEGKHKGIKIENTAAAGNDAKTAVFHSAGEHMIVARSESVAKVENGEQKGIDQAKLDKKEAFAAIVDYVQVFMGPDVSSKLKEDECFALPGEGGEPAGDQKNGEGGESSTNESVGFNMSFQQFIGEATEDDSDSAGPDDETGDAGPADDDDGDDGGDTDEDGDDDGSSGTEEDGDDNGDADEDGDNNGGQEEDRDSGKEGGEEGESDPAKVQEAKGFYILYGLKIKGLKETTKKEALKQWGSNFLKGFGVRLGSMWGGLGSEVHTVGGLMDAAHKLFGSLTMPDDTDEIVRNIETTLKRKFPDLTIQTVDIRDQRTLLKELDATNHENYNGKTKQKIKSAEYSLYIHVEDDDPVKPFLNRKEVANIVTLSIKGLIKKFKHMIKADDVIYLKGEKLNGKVQAKIKDIELKIPSFETLAKEIFSDVQKQEVKKDKNKIWTNVDKLFKAITGKNAKVKSDKVDTMAAIWTKYINTWKDSSGMKDNSLIAFFNEYKDVYNKIVAPTLKESADGIVKSILRRLFESMSSTAASNILTEVEFDEDELFESKLSDYIEQNKLTKEQALSDDHFKAIKKATKQGDEKAKAAIEKYFANKDAGAADGGQSAEANADGGETAAGNTADNSAGTETGGKETSTGEVGKETEPRKEDTGTQETGKEGAGDKPSGKPENEDNPDQDVKLSATKRPRIKTGDEAADEKINRVSDDFHLAIQGIGEKRAGFKAGQFDAFAPVKMAERWLDYFGVAGDFKSKDGEHKYAFFLMLKAPKTQSWHKKKDGSDSKPTLKSSWGYNAFNEGNVKQAMESSLGKDGKLVEFFKFKPVTANANFPYNDTKVPADTEVYAGFVDELPGVLPPGPEGETPVVFIVPDFEDPEKFDEAKDVVGGPLPKSEATPEKIAEFTEAAKKLIAERQQTATNESRLYEADDNDGIDDNIDDEDDEGGEDKPSVYEFDKWDPEDPGKAEKKVTVGGKEVLGIFARFKKDGETPPGPEPKPEGGDDLYIIPMPGIRAKKEGDDDWKPGS